MKPPKFCVHLVHPPAAEALAYLQDKLDPSIGLTFGPEILDPADFQILVEGVPSREFVEASPHLKSLIIPWAGLPTATRQLMLEFPQISVHNLHHNASATAEMSLALLFAAAKFVVPMDRALRQNDWTPRYQPNPSILLQGKTALILGYGAIGQHVGRVLQAMGLRVMGIRRTPQPDDIAEVHPVTALPDLLPQTDILMITAPLTPETEGLIGEKELALLPAGAILTNVGRGAIVAQKALYEALKNGHLRAAGLDVWYNYPTNEESRPNTPPSDYPFHELDNIVLSPHRGGGARETELLRMETLAHSLNAIPHGEPIPNKVDLQVGY